MDNYKVVIVEQDFYARQAINSYLAWDRRTRVTQRLADLGELTAYLDSTALAELPDTILLDGALLPTAEYTEAALNRIHHQTHQKAHVLVMAHIPLEPIAKATFDFGGRGYVDRAEVGLQISWMIVWARKHRFVATHLTAPFVPMADVLPHAREYPELTDRVRQALMLCVVEGMSADLAADEMGLSPHTIRTYIKEGYSILEAHSDQDYPADLSPQEKAFMRFTALSLEDANPPRQDS
jgi:DNA-binding NarL/FixJ family response regulator